MPSVWYNAQVPKMIPSDPKLRLELEIRFWSKVKTVHDDSSCWEWQGAASMQGYGVISIQGKRYLTHRVSWSLENGEILPEAPWILHSCDNPPCVRPNHLYAGTQDQNVLDAKTHGAWKALADKRRSVIAASDKKFLEGLGVDFEELMAGLRTRTPGRSCEI